MFTKLLTALVTMVLIGSSIFNLRQQRLELMHEITGLHRQMNRDRQGTWDTQVRIAQRIQPEALHDALVRLGVPMEPAVAPSLKPDDERVPYLTHASHERR